jgi:hypothetical protein
MRQETTPHRHRRCEALVVRADTLCAHVGSLLDHVDRHDNPSDGPSPLAHHPVTRCSGSGPVRFPWGLRLSRRAAEWPPWAAPGATHVPDITRPPAPKARPRLPQQGDSGVRQAPDGRARHEPCRTPMALARALGEEPIRPTGPCGVVVCDAWHLAAAGGPGRGHAAAGPSPRGCGPRVAAPRQGLDIMTSEG